MNWRTVGGASALAALSLLGWLLFDCGDPVDPAGDATVAVPQTDPRRDTVEARPPVETVGERREVAPPIEGQVDPNENGTPVFSALDGPGARVTGRLVEHDGRPVPGAILRVRSQPDPASSFLYLLGADESRPAAGAFDAVVTDGDGLFDLRFAEDTARAGFGHGLTVVTADGRWESLELPRVGSGDRVDDLILRLPAARRLDIDVPDVDLQRLTQDRYVDFDRDRSWSWDVYRDHGLVGATGHVVDGEGRITALTAVQTGGRRLTAWLDPEGSAPLEVELTIPGRELASAPVTRAGVDAFHARLSAPPQRELTLRVRSAVAGHREGEVRLEVRGNQEPSLSREHYDWAAHLRVRLEELPREVVVALGSRSIDLLEVVLMEPDGSEQLLASCEPELDPRPLSVEIPAVGAWPPPDPRTTARQPSCFDLSPETVTVAGTAIDAVSGEPLAGVVLVRSGLGGPLTIERPASAPSDGRGRTLAGGLPPHVATTVGFDLPGYRLETVEVPPLAAGSRYDLGHVALEPEPPSHRLRVLGPDGEPVAGIAVALGQLTRETDVEGRVGFPSRPPYDTSFVTVGREPGWRFAPPTGPDEVTLRLTQVRSVELRIEGGVGRPFQLIDVDLRKAGVDWLPDLGFFGAPLEDAPRRDAWFLLDLPAGRYRLGGPVSGTDAFEFTVEPGTGRQVVDASTGG
ncbi:hypothetical protein [Engelhardtia mirabilis]|uniref:Uncharacterized protein n=1 Tax=Engelhardtia mirabilis TaxID=2528011 RepID=A0A518BJU6_9BACT|nr:hypothetical protein Pla133_22910 [Planctomycetes bacterium Pla133]QDV01540.1 hypothetical protein Pla86_22910 [Planctomycetes bacterium Pla86]